MFLYVLFKNFFYFWYTFIAPKSYSLTYYLNHFFFHLLLFCSLFSWSDLEFCIEVKILLCLHFSFMTHHFTFIANFFGLQASNFLRNNYLNINKFILALSEEVKIYSFRKSRGTGYFDIARSRVTISCLASCLIGISRLARFWVARYSIIMAVPELFQELMHVVSAFWMADMKVAILGKWRFLFIYFWWKQNTCVMVFLFSFIDHLRASVAEWIQKTTCFSPL
jgi:hypothetical protein